MPEIFTTLIKINIALLLFCAGYYLVLRRLTFYTLNRAYLVAAILFSSMYPFIDLSVFVQRHQDIVAPVQDVVVYWKAPAENFVQQAAYWNWLEIAFWTGVALFAARLILQLLSLYKIYRRSVEQQINGQAVRVVDGDISPFSFWQSIYINPEKLSPTDLHNILEHEQIHVKEWHTLDVLLAEISVVFYWFNPGIWMMKRAVSENIEFITDRKILQQGKDSKAYQYSLLNVTFNQSAPTVTSTFNFSTLKKRIKMMNAKRSSKINLTRYALLLPAVVVCLFVLSLSKAEVAKANPVIATIKETVNNIKAAVAPKDTVPAKTITGTLALKTDSNGKKTRAVTFSEPFGRNFALNVDSQGRRSAFYVVMDNSRKDSISFRVLQRPLDTIHYTRRTAGVAQLHGLSINTKGEINSDRTYIYSSEKNDTVAFSNKVAKTTRDIILKEISEARKNKITDDKLAPRVVNGMPLNATTNVEKSQTNKFDARIGEVNGTIQLITTDPNGIQRYPAQPMFILDGKEIDQKDLKAVEGNIEYVSPNNAKEKYGDKGKNGVVIITTKKK